MKKTVKRFLSMLLALSMMFGMLAVPVAATETEEPAATVEPAEEAAPAAETAEDTVPAAETTEDTVSEPATAEGAVSAGETTEEAVTASQEEAEEPVVVVKGSSFNYQLWAENIEVSTDNVPVPEDVEVDEDAPEIIAVTDELKDITVLNEDGESVPLTQGQIDAVVAYFQVYLKILADNADIYGVQTPFFLSCNDGEDSLGILGEMLVLAGYTVEDVRAGNYAYMDLVMMIKTFTYTYGKGAEYYGAAIRTGRDEALQAVENSGAQTEAQKLLVLNTWLAQNNTFDMPYIMNADSDKSGTVEDDEKIMAAPKGSPQNKNYDDLYGYIEEDLTAFFTDMFKGEIKAGFEADLRKSVFEEFIKSIYAEGILTQMIADENVRKEAATAYVEQKIWQDAYDAYMEEPSTQEDVTYTFTYTDEDGKVTAAATMTCKDKDWVYEDPDCKIQDAIVPATCKTTGSAAYTATATFKDAEGNVIATVGDTQAYTKELPIDTENGHTVPTTAEFKWDDTETEAESATATCSACGTTFTATKEDGFVVTNFQVTKEATCGAEGEIKRTAEATFRVNGETCTLTDTKTAPVPATGVHEFDPVTGACKNCDAVDPNKDAGGSGEGSGTETGEGSGTGIGEDSDAGTNTVSDAKNEAVVNSDAETASNAEATKVTHTFDDAVTLNKSEDDAKAAADKAVEDARENGTVTAKVGALTTKEVDALAEAAVRGGVKDSDEDKNTKTEYEKRADQQAKEFVEKEDNQKAISDDPAAFLKNMLIQGGASEEQADAVVAQAEEQAAAVIEKAATDGIQVATLEDGTPVIMTTEQIVDQTMANEKIVDMNGDGKGDTTPNDAIPMYVAGATPGLTDATINGWKGCHIGAFGLGTSVCLGYAMAYAYLVQCMHPEVYLKTRDAADMNDAKQWKTREEVYGDNLDDSDYLVDCVRVTFNTKTTMYGNEGSFGEVHFWNAVKVEDQWYYIDPCYVDVYVEVMSRDRVETDGNMNHLYFLFSHTSAAKMYDGYVNTDFGLKGEDGKGDGITSLYSTVATDKSYEDSWMSRINCTPYFADGYAYYIYDSSNLLAMMDSSKSEGEMDFSSFETHYKLARHALTSSDIGDGDSDFETLIDFNAEDTDGNAEVQVLSKSEGMVRSDLLTELYDRHSTYSEIYPSVEITSVLYDGKVYFNLANCILSYDPASCDVALVKEYNTVSANRDETVDFGGRAFFVKENGAYTVENHPIAALSLVGNQLTVSIATNFALISGKDDLTNPAIKRDDGSGNLIDNGYGYEYEESNYNPSYNSYYTSDEENDNDEFMWSANFVDKVGMSHLAGGSHSYAEVTVDPFCGIDGYTEQRCTECGAIQADSRVYDEGTAHEHHYIHFFETYYTKSKSNGDWNTGDCYVCTMCGYAVSEPSEQLKEQAEDEYNRLLQEYNDAVESAGHTYVPTDDAWSEDGTSVTFQNLKCSNVCPTRKNRLDVLLNDNSITKELSEPVTAEAKMDGYEGYCTDPDGVTAVYVASGEVEDVEDDGTTYSYSYTATNKVQKGRGEHSYSNDDFTWTENKDADGNPTGDYTVTAEVLECEICGYTLKNIKATGTKVATKHENPTCTTAGKDVYEATGFTDENDQAVDGVTATKEVELPALGHKYEAHNDAGTGYDDTEEWNDDHSSVTVTFTCINEGCDAEPVEVTVTTEESDNGVINEPVSTAPDCVTPGTVTYSATITLDGTEYTVEEVVTEKALGHKYGDPVWNWAKDYSEATVSMTCTNEGCTAETEGHELSTKAEVKSETIAATCTEAGKIVYTATAVLNDQSCTDTKEEEIAPTGHKYGDPVWNWAKDYSEATVSMTCTNEGCTEETEGHKLSANATVTPETIAATCTEAGKIVYTATAVLNGESCTDTKEEEIAPTGHKYGDPVWNWAKDYSEATVSMTCTNEGCAEETEGHKLSANATVIPETIDATCTEAGKTVYTATATLNGETYTDVQAETIAKKPHQYGEPTFKWTEDGSSCKASFICAEGGETEIKDCTITSETEDATCTNAGAVVYTATVELEGKTYSDTLEIESKPLGHQYGEEEWFWAEDYSVATVSMTCTREGCTEETEGHKLSAKATVTPETTDATCTEAGKTVYTATATLNGVERSNTRTVTKDALGHDYGEPEWSWTTDHSKATATFTCTRCKDVQTVVDENVTKKTTEASCTQDGENVYTATVEFNGKTYTGTAKKTINALGHDYGEPVWNWATDYSTASATITCARCLEEVTDEAEVTHKTTQEATCTEEGIIVHSATVTLDGKTYTDPRTEKVPMLAHDYSAPTFAWEEDGSACVATYTCSVGGETGTKSCTITSETEDATCTEAGTVVYTATVEVGGKTYTNNKKIEGQPLGHTYGAPVWTWADDYSKAIATFTCTVCSEGTKDHTLNVDATVTSKTTDATCKAAGKTVYTATATLKGEKYEDQKEVTIPQLSHQYSKPTFTWAADYSSCEAAYTCSVGGETETKPCIISSETKDATCAEAGSTVYTATVEVDGETHTDTKTVTKEALGHTYGAPVWTWEDDCSKATATFTCTVCSEGTKDHTLDVEATVTSKVTKEATCTEKGTIAYTATVTLNGEPYTDVQTKEIAKLDHQYGAPTFAWEKDYSACKASYTCSVGGETETQKCKVTSETKDATCTEAGATVYTATVEVDGKTYTDTKEEKIDPLGHTYGEPEWVWADDNSKATATITCEVCSDELTGEAKVTSKTTQELTCTVDGVVVYTATVTLNGETYTDAKTEVTKAAGHDYDEDGVCKVCGAGNVRRISGKTRYETALAVADELKKELGVKTFTTILVANGGDYPDALAGSYLAMQKDAPILLTENKADSKTNGTILDYIEENLRSDGMVYILGGTGSVPKEFADSLEQAGIAFQRLAGANRYETALKILEKAGLNGNEILVCSGNGYADALSISAVNKPVLLVNGTSKKLSDAQKEYLDALNGDYTFYIVGGTGTVSVELEEVFKTYGTVERVAGGNRHTTSVAVAEKFYPNADFATLAPSMNFADGLCGGPLAYVLGAPLLLVSANNEAGAAKYVEERNIEKGVVFGGSYWIPDDSVRTVFGLDEDATIG